MRQTNKIQHKTRALLVTLALLLCTYVSFAQQDPVYSQYMNNISSVNPAYVGIRGVASFTTLNRKQWVGFKDAPFTSSLTLGLPIDSLGKMGLGFDFMFDNTRPQSYTSLFVDYSYRVKTSSISQLSFGLKGGLNYLQPSLIDLDRFHYDDEYILTYGDEPHLMPNFGVGVYWYTSNFYVGLSVPRLLRNRFHKDAVVLQAASREERHYFFHTAYSYQISPSTVFKPGFASIVTPGTPATASFDFSFMFYEQFWVGATYRISDALGGYTQFQYQNIKIGLSYEYPLTDMGYNTFGTFEVMLRFDFKTNKRQMFPSPFF